MHPELELPTQLVPGRHTPLFDAAALPEPQDDLREPYFTFDADHVDWQAHIRSVADHWQHVVLRESST